MAYGIQGRTQGWIKDINERIDALEAHKEDLTAAEIDQLADLVRELNKLTEGPY